MAKNLQISLLLDFYGEMLTEKQRDVVELYYNEDLSLAEIAEHSGITRQGVRDAIKRAEAQLLSYEERLGLARRFRTMQEGLEQIATLAAEVYREGRQYGFTLELARKTQEIHRLAGALNE